MCAPPPTRAAISTLVFTSAVMISCSDPVPPTPTVESLALSLDSIAIQFRDSASELTASPRGALGVELDANVAWRSKNTRIVTVIPNGKVVRLVPVRPGATEVEALAENQVAVAKVVVLDTVFSVQIAADTIVTMGQALPFTATVSGPPGAARRVVWSVSNSVVATIDSSRGNNPVLVVSRDTGSTDITATPAIDRNKSARARFRTARPVSLYFDTQPAQSTVPIRANDVMIPGPLLKVRDILGNVFPGSTTVAMAITPDAATSAASLFGTPVLATTNGEARFENLGLDLSGAGYRLTATSPGLAAATSSTFTVGPECVGTPYTTGTTVSGNLTASACQSRANEFYDRHVVTTPVQQFLTFRVSSTSRLRVGIVFPDGARTGPLADSVTVVVAPGAYSVRVYSSPSGASGQYQLISNAPNIPRANLGVGEANVCQRISLHRGITFQDELRCARVPSPLVCGTSATTQSLYQLHLPAKATATITVTSGAFDPCLRVTHLGDRLIAEDVDVPGRNTARVVVPAEPVARVVFVYVAGPFTLATGAPFTMSIQQ